jgi:hypothetical protein
MLQVEISSDPNSNSEHLLKLKNDLYLYQKIILPFQLELKSIHKILNRKIKPIRQKNGKHFKTGSCVKQN